LKKKKKKAKYISVQRMHLLKNFSLLHVVDLSFGCCLRGLLFMYFCRQQNRKTVSSYSIPSPCVTVIAWVPNIKIERIAVFLVCDCFMYENGFHM